MPETQSSERPLGVYLVALYFVLAGFLESTKTYWEWNAPLSLNPMAEHSVWVLAVDIGLYLVLALLIWNYASFGRLAGLVHGYAMLAMWISIAIALALGTTMNITPLKVSLAIYHITANIPLLVYLQPARQKKVFHVSLLDLLFSSE